MKAQASFFPSSTFVFSVLSPCFRKSMNRHPLNGIFPAFFLPVPFPSLFGFPISSSRRYRRILCLFLQFPAPRLLIMQSELLCPSRAFPPVSTIWCPPPLFLGPPPPPPPPPSLAPPPPPNVFDLRPRLTQRSSAPSSFAISTALVLFKTVARLIRTLLTALTTFYIGQHLRKFFFDFPSAVPSSPTAIGQGVTPFLTPSFVSLVRKGISEILKYPLFPFPFPA